MCTPMGFFRKANHYYNNFNWYALDIAKSVVCTSENMAEPDNDVIKIASSLNFNETKSTLHHIILNTESFFKSEVSNCQSD